eukprot:CAMPEP_0194125022 /NCGR_PEP_ID=MMETSP0150-20130528/59246_1 /TAXON_ID=122233 /ORGANISM="Chaetoceros debilis, Strain MM31A-1" /LENGTH=459 /DNA_ID=CAMNT_0038818811 /DNA_START=104 /DNA_END=1483 /DNA_ORIENTATION=+
MKLHIYYGLDDEEVPEDVTHVMIDNSVAVIKRGAFQRCYHLVCVIMCDNVWRIEGYAFNCCRALRFIRLSKTLEYIGEFAFCGCDSLEALFLPSTVKSIGYRAFGYCRSLRLMILPVAVIKRGAFQRSYLLVCVIMCDNVKRIEGYAFWDCHALRIIRLSKTLGYIGARAFCGCKSLEALVLPSTVKSIEDQAFNGCRSLRLMILPHDIDFGNIEYEIFGDTAIYQIAVNTGVKYEMMEGSLEALFLPSTVKSIGYRAFGYCRSLRLMILPHDIDFGNIGYEIFGDTAIYQIAVNTGVKYEYVDIFTCTPESILRVNEWMYHHMDEFPLHKLCYSSSVTVKQINDYLIEHDDDGNGVLVTLAIDPHHGMNQFHMLAMNPYAPAEAIAALLDTNFQAVFRTDYKQNTPLDYARDYNVGGLVGMISGLCNHRNLSGPLRVGDTQSEHANKRMKLEHSIKID